MDSCRNSLFEDLKNNKRGKRVEKKINKTRINIDSLTFLVSNLTFNPQAFKPIVCFFVKRLR